MNSLTTKPTEIDWARLAAFIDGEGCIRIADHRARRGQHMDFQISNTDSRLIIWLHDTFGGSFCERKHAINSRSRVWVWYIASDAAAEALQNCLPFFVMKRDQAEQAIAFQKLIQIHRERTSKGKSSAKGRRVPADEMMARQACAVALVEARGAYRERIN